MIDIAAYDLNKYYGANHVIKGVTFEIFSGEKVGLLGRNGSGKTTLFKVITGEEPYESGAVTRAAGRRIEMLAQVPVFGEADTVEDILRSSFQEAADVFAEMKTLEGDMAPQALKRYGQLLEEYERLGGYHTEVALDKVCGGMHIDAGMRKSLFRQLSGGEKTRVNLARILLRDCDILLLDEPTNHLDFLSLEWLEKFLREFSGTVVVISHDRVFLDRVITRIIEIEDGKAAFYQGNYSYYMEEKQQRLASQTEQYEQQQKKIRQLETAAKRLHTWAKQADSGALHRRAFAIEKRIEQMDKVDRPVTARALTAEFDSGGHAGRETVSFQSVCKSFGTKALLRDLSLKIYRNDRIALVGPNGCGKSTLLKLIMRELTCDSGSVRLSVNVKPAYMPQIIEYQRGDATILETFRLETGAPEEKARGVLARFRFGAEDVLKPVGALSGGEKSRLKLCLMMQNNVNFLLLDEPTNHLDIPSREWIERALTDFDGTMLFVSHDRYFINQFASEVWSMEDGAITRYERGLEAYFEAMRAAPPKKSRAKNPAPKKNAKTRAKKTVSAEVLIRDAEDRRRELNAAIESALSTSDFLEINTLYQRLSQLEAHIDLLYEEWLQEDSAAGGSE